MVGEGNCNEEVISMGSCFHVDRTFTLTVLLLGTGSLAQLKQAKPGRLDEARTTG